MKRLLYLSCHTTLECEELQVFNDLGFEITSIGDYLIPEMPLSQFHTSYNYLSNTRKPLNLKYNKDLVKKFAQANPSFTFDSINDHNNITLPPGFVDNFDVIVACHHPIYLSKIFETTIPKIPIIWRSVGQSDPYVESLIKVFREKVGIKIIRFSDSECNINGFCGSDKTVRLGIDPNEFSNWNGNGDFVMSVCRGIEKRMRLTPNIGDICNYGLYQELSNNFNIKLYGSDNEGVRGSMGSTSFDTLRQAYRNCKAFYVTHTKPAPYNLSFIEAWMTGSPVVVVGPELGNRKGTGVEGVYEVHQYIKNGENGFCSDNLEKLKEYISELLNNDSLRTKISERGRTSALELFSKERFKNDWKEVFTNLGLT